MSDEMGLFIRNNIEARRMLHLAHRDLEAQCGMAAALHVGAIAMAAVMDNFQAIVAALDMPATRITTDDIRSEP